MDGLREKVHKVLIPLFGDDVAPRFDLVNEALIVILGPDGEVRDHRTVLLARASAEDLCHLILTDGVEVVICGGIEEEYAQYLSWKKARVVDSVMGPWNRVLDRYRQGRLKSGDVLFEP